MLVVCGFVNAQENFEGKKIERIDIIFLGVDKNISANEEFRLIAKNALGERFSAVNVRDAIEAIYRTNRVVSIDVEGDAVGENGVNLRFLIKRKTRAERIYFEITRQQSNSITEQELLLKLNLVSAGQSVSEQILRANADLILSYMRERGFFNAEVVPETKPLSSPTDVQVIFKISTGQQARISDLTVKIQGVDEKTLLKPLKSQVGAGYSRAVLNDDIQRLKNQLLKKNFLAPVIFEPRVRFDSETNSIAITVSGNAGGQFEVKVKGENAGIGNKTQTRLLPIKRDGTVDYSALVEGERRLANYYQERGYFFAKTKAVCTLENPTATELQVAQNGTALMCSALSSFTLDDRKVAVNYEVDLNRRLKLIDIRIEGTKEISIADIKSVLESQEASSLGIVPILGYGRGYTSNELLREDRETIGSLMRELGFRDASVRIKQGVSPEGEDLIITFIVNEGVPTRIAGIDVEGNKLVDKQTILNELPNLVGKNYARARARNGLRKIAEYYSATGFYEAKLDYSIVEIANTQGTEERLVKIIYRVENEGKPVIINRVLVTGNNRTKTDALYQTLTLKPDQPLRQLDIFSSEQNLYGTDAFKRIEIKPENAGEDGKGNRLTDVIISVDEQAPREIKYGGGYSTDAGVTGFFDLRHFNLFGKLKQGGVRVRLSPRRQIVQFDYIDPRFRRDGENRFIPLNVTLQYQRDETVTRFFRSVFDSGTFGIVQRIDANGNPTDEFGRETGVPTINRLTFTAETNKTIDTKTRSLAFLRFKFEDVRLFNIDSLLIRDLLLPDARIRTSGFGLTFVRDTRKNCNNRYSLLELIEKGEPGNPCRYNAGDATRGSYLTADYSFSHPALGANIGYHKFQAAYRAFYTSPLLKNTTFAGSGVLGLASVFSRRREFSSTQFPDLDGILPISERFFAGGSQTLRGFDAESAGPRVVVIPQGIFRDSSGSIVTLDPFTIPFGGNALAIANLEARIPLTSSIRAVLFYDGGNVFRKVGDLFNPPDAATPNDFFTKNLRAVWTHTIGFGFRIKTPFGADFGVDYGYLLNPPTFTIPQRNAPDAFYRLQQGQFHFRFSQAF